MIPAMAAARGVFRPPGVTPSFSCLRAVIISPFVTASFKAHAAVSFGVRSLILNFRPDVQGNRLTLPCFQILG